MQNWLAMAVMALAAAVMASTADKLMVAGNHPLEQYGSISQIEPAQLTLAPTLIEEPNGNSKPEEEEPASASGSGEAIEQAQAVTELKADDRGHYITEAEIDGATVQVMVDTGASAVALSYEDADNAGLRPHRLDYDVPVSTANGIAHAARVTLRRVEVDGVMVRDVEGLVLPEGVMSGTLLGMSFLKRLSSFKVEDGTLYLED